MCATALVVYVAWYVWSRKLAFECSPVLRPLFTLVSFLLRALGPLLSVHYRIIFHDSFLRMKRMGWPYYNQTAQAPQSIFSWHPHSALTVLPFTFWQSSEVFGRNVYVGVAAQLYKIPALREILMIGNCRIANESVLSKLLDTGSSIMMQPGGVYEQIRFTDEHETAYFSSNLGFIRMAVRSGVPVVPVYSFGENQLYKVRPDRRRVSSWLTSLGVPTPAASGKFGLPAGLFCLPGKPVVVVGKAIPVKKILSRGEAEDAEVSRVFKVYLQAIRGMWRDHSHHLPASIAVKGLRMVYRAPKEGKEVISDVEENDADLLAAFQCKCCDGGRKFVVDETTTKSQR